MPRSTNQLEQFCVFCGHHSIGFIDSSRSFVKSGTLPSHFSSDFLIVLCVISVRFLEDFPSFEIIFTSPNFIGDFYSRSLLKQFYNNPIITLLKKIVSVDNLSLVKLYLLPSENNKNKIFSENKFLFY